MVEVKPLNAIVYNKDMVDIKDVIAPPYDVISDDYRAELAERSPFNIVELILAKGSKDLEDKNNCYDKASKTFVDWKNKKVLINSEKPCIFYILQKYTTESGRKIVRKGFIARNKIEDFESKKILPHEFTMSGPKADRLNLTKKCKANFSQIFMVYSDAENKIEKSIDFNQKPFIDVFDDNGVENVVYKIDDEKILNLVTEVMKEKTLLIADGHHRYETAMNYRNYMRERENDENAEYNYVMSYFTNLNDKNLVVFPTHRIITKRIEPYDLLEKVKKYYDVAEFIFDGQNKNQVKEKFLSELEKANEKQISHGLYMKNVNKFYLLRLRENVDKILDEYNVPQVLKSLDLIVLHKVLISKEFGYTEDEQMSQSGIKYIKQEREAFDMVDAGKAEASFIMAYPKIEMIQRISSAGYRMPQKSTYFYPKLLSGIVISPLYK